MVRRCFSAISMSTSSPLGLPSPVSLGSRPCFSFSSLSRRILTIFSRTPSFIINSCSVSGKIYRNTHLGRVSRLRTIQPHDRRNGLLENISRKVLPLGREVRRREAPILLAKTVVRDDV